MLTNINFRGIQVNGILKENVQNGNFKPSEEFYRFANYLDGKLLFDFRLKQINRNKIKVSAYQRGDRSEIGACILNLDSINRNASAAIGEVAYTTNNNRFGARRFWIDEFENSSKSADTDVFEKAPICEDDDYFGY